MPDKYQKQVLSYIECGDSLFVTGKAGTGKTYILKVLKERCEGKKVVAAVDPDGYYTWAFMFRIGKVRSVKNK